MVCISNICQYNICFILMYNGELDYGFGVSLASGLILWSRPTSLIDRATENTAQFHGRRTLQHYNLQVKKYESNQAVLLYRSSDCTLEEDFCLPQSGVSFYKNMRLGSTTRTLFPSRLAKRTDTDLK